MNYNRFGQVETELGGAATPNGPTHALVVAGGTEVDIDDVRVRTTGYLQCSVVLFFLFSYIRSVSTSKARVHGTIEPTTAFIPRRLSVPSLRVL